MPEMKGITARIPAELHAEMKAYITAHQMTIEQFIKIAIENELHPKLVQEGKSMERKRTLAFEVPDSLFQRVKAYLERNHMTQKQFVIGLIEAELEQDEAQYQASRPEEQEDEGESDDQTENEAQEEAQDEFAPQEAQDGPESQQEEQPAAQEDAAPVDDFEAGSEEVSQENGRTEEAWVEENQEAEEGFEDSEILESDSLDDVEEVEDTEAQEDSQDEDEEEEQSYQPGMAW